MRNIIKISLVLLSAAFMQSCTKVIDVKLKDADKKYVIEGILTDEPGQCKVLLSKTKNFSEGNSPVGISGASVSIKDNTDGSMVALTELSPGVYTQATFAGIPGHSYELSVAVSGATFTAVSHMPLKVKFDSLFISKDQLFGEERTLANLVFTDPPAYGHSYRAVQYINGRELKNIFVTNDDYTNNKVNYAKLFIFSDNEADKAKPGDTVTVDMQCIDPVIYRYWYSLDQGATGNSQSAAPANPVTNITGGAIGYFSAHTIETKTTIVPE
jgi:hypothetical protein